MSDPALPRAPRLSIVLATQGASEHVPGILSKLSGVLADDTELIVCAGAEDRATRVVCNAVPFVRYVEGATASLIPHSWRDGILASRAARVALTTSHCWPTADWVEAVQRADLDTYAAVGGSLFNDETASAPDWAIYMLRFLKYAASTERRETWDLPGDNVVYDREKIMAYATDFAAGFWEVAIHRRMQADGHRLLFDPALAIMHRNGYSPMEFARQRFRHGGHFGRTRAKNMPLVERAAYLAATPAIPAVLGGKILRRVLETETAWSDVRGSLPYLAFFLHAWAAGEATGVLRALTDRGARRGE